VGSTFISYFIAGYFFSVKPFSETPDILGYLDMIFFKDVNIESSIAFIRDNYVLDKAIRAIENPEMSGSGYYISLAEASELKYLSMRKNMPEVF
jgi:hypothetical protein